MQTISQKKNVLMNREEAWVSVEHKDKPTPTRKDILADVAKHFKANEDCVIVDKIFTEAGRSVSKVKVLVYHKAEDIPKAKLDKMKIRMGLMKKEPKTAAPAGPAGPLPGQTKPAEKPEKND